MRRDLDELLNAFPYESGRLNARLERASDGREVLLVRLELGILQLECEGRPDGRPTLVTRREQRPLTADEAALWRLELVQFQQRAMAFWAVGDFGRTLRDAETVVEGATLLERWAPDAEGAWAVSARFSALVLRTRAGAMALLERGGTREAASVLEQGLDALRIAAAQSGLGASYDQLSDVIALRTWRESLVPQLPPAQRSELEARLHAAIRAENYELAAILRDELRLLS
ncbi:MAG: UvrB/UvrC motif-containing protein [Limnohabitans sp.]|jgi:hypothetical protein|nr:UvrB/UvrC motif-containing protein [Limnohabitans sp.]